MKIFWISLLSSMLCVSSIAFPDHKTVAPQSIEETSLYYGVFVDGNAVTSDEEFEAMILDLQSRHMNSIAFAGVTPNLAISDQLGMNIIASPMGALREAWFLNDQANADIETARLIIAPIIEELKDHVSVQGYNIFDDAIPSHNEKLRLAVDVIREIDPTNPASPVLVRGRQGREVYHLVRPDAFLTYYNPIRNFNDHCEFYGIETGNWVETLRMTIQEKPPETPLWLVLQAHSTVTGPDDTDPSHLRAPRVEEIRLLNWLALGEQAQGIFWFTYFSMADHPWQGIQDNPDIYEEITSLASRVDEMRPIFAGAQKIADRFTAASSAETYTSTFYQDSSNQYYVLVVNHDCNEQELSVDSDYLRGRLRNIETDEIYELTDPILFRGGDAKLFELIDSEVLPTLPDFQENLVENASFEFDSDMDGRPDAWTPYSPARIDTTVSHDGSASLRLAPGTSLYSQRLNLKPNTRYYLSHWIKMQNFDDNLVGMSYLQLDEQVTYVSDTFYSQYGDSDWVKRIAYFRTPANLTNGRLDINWIIGPSAIGWIDDITLCEVELPCEDQHLQEITFDEVATSPR